MSGLATVRRVGWGVGDQALSSLTNFFMGILVARTVSPDDFGAFSLAFGAYVLALVVSRGLTGEPLVVRHSHDSRYRLARRDRWFGGAGPRLRARRSGRGPGPRGGRRRAAR